MTKPAIPARLNLTLATLQVLGLLALLRSATVAEGWWLLAPALAYGLLMNSAYALLHEAEHGILHPKRWINDSVGAILALFFPAAFHLIRQSHLGHHRRNRSDDEAFDVYFEDENTLWKRLQLAGILTGLFWIVVVLSNFVAVLFPSLLQPRKVAFDRPTEALLESLNPRWTPIIRLEALAAIALHVGLIWLWQIPLLHWLAVMSGFGVMWSAMQYVHHFGTERDVIDGSLNLRTWRWLDALWLHHNWHQRHHRYPTVPWVYLPQLEEGPVAKRPHLLLAYLRMWRGPKLTHDRVSNHHAGQIIH